MQSVLMKCVPHTQTQSFIRRGDSSVCTLKTKLMPSKDWFDTLAGIHKVKILSYFSSF